MMTLKQYQDDAAKTAIYDQSSLVRTELDRINYVMVGLGGETGELLNKWKKVLRGDKPLTPERKTEMAHELGGILWYVSQISKEIGFDLDVVAMLNLDELRHRQASGTIMGDGDKR